MKSAQKTFKSTLSLIFILALFVSSTKSILAQAALGLSAIPPRLEVKVKSDDIITQTIKVRNDSSIEKVIDTNAFDFIVTDNKGTPVKINTTSADNRWAASSWITVSPASIKLKPGETKSLVLSITPPKDALPGGHYAMVVHSPQNLSTINGTGASVNTEVGTLVYITIPGDIKESALIKKFTAPSFLEFGPVDFQATIENLSDIHINPDAGITIKNWLGAKSAFLNLNKDKTNIFPYTSRDFKTTFDRKFLFGRYTAQLDAQYGTADNLVTASLVFWVIPWRLLILITAAIAIIVAIILINKNKPQLNPLSTSNDKVEELEKELEDLKNKYKDKA